MSRRSNLNRGSRWWALGLAAMVLAASSGCASLPTSGTVQAGDPDVNLRSPLIQKATGPVKGSSPERLLLDFQQACAAGPYENFATAKLYLTPGATKHWQPDQRITVLDDPGGLKITVGKEAKTAAGRGKALLQVDHRGLPLAFNPQQEVQYGLQQVGGEWRIASLPSGIYLGRSAFQNAYAWRSVYFWSADQTMLISDPRWLPRKNVGQSLVAGLFAGPSPALYGGVYTAFSPQKEVTSPFQLKGTTARINLPSDFPVQSTAALALGYQQIEQTLSGVAGINTIELWHDNHRLDFTQPSRLEKGVSGILVGLKEGAVVENSDGYEKELVAKSYLAGEDVHWPTAGGKNGTVLVAVRGNKELVLLQENKRPVTIYRDANLRRPEVDHWGWIWTGNTQVPNQVTVTDQNGNEAKVELPWRDQGQIKHLDLNSQGSRAIVVREVNQSEETEILTVKRNPEGKPLALINRLRPFEQLTRVLSAQWVSPNEAAVLSGTGAEEKPRVAVYAVNSFTEVMEAPEEARSLLGESPDGSIQLVTRDNTQFLQVGKIWRREGGGLVEPSFVG